MSQRRCSEIDERLTLSSLSVEIPKDVQADARTTISHTGSSPRSTQDSEMKEILGRFKLSAQPSKTQEPVEQDSAPAVTAKPPLLSQNSLAYLEKVLAMEFEDDIPAQSEKPQVVSKTHLEQPELMNTNSKMSHLTLQSVATLKSKASELTTNTRTTLASRACPREGNFDLENTLALMSQDSVLGNLEQFKREISVSPALSNSPVTTIEEETDTVSGVPELSTDSESGSKKATIAVPTSMNKEESMMTLQAKATPVVLARKPNLSKQKQVKKTGCWCF